MSIDSKNFLSYSIWLSLPFDMRYKIAEVFGIRQSVSRHVVDSTIISDGFAPSSLAVITKERLRELTGKTGDDFYALFDAFVEQLKNPKVEQLQPSQQVQQTETKNELTPNVEQEKSEEAKPARKIGRPRKAKGGE